MTKQTVIVLFGGRSAEHDVSRTSAVAVLRSIDQTRYNVLPIGITPDGGWVRSVSAQAYLAAVADGTDPASLPGQVDPVGVAIDPSSLLPALAGGTSALGASSRATGSAGKTGDIVNPEGNNDHNNHNNTAALPIVLPILHGPFGEDGTMQGLLELAGVPYVGAGVLASAVAMDKGIAKELFAVAGLAQAKWLTVAAWDVADGASRVAFVFKAGEELGYPVFVKPANLGSSVGVSKAVDAESLHGALELAFWL